MISLVARMERSEIRGGAFTSPDYGLTACIRATDTEGLLYAWLTALLYAGLKSGDYRVIK